MNGLVDAEAARATVRRLKLRDSLKRLVGGGSTLLDLLDHRAEADGEQGAALFQGGVGLSGCDQKGGVDHAAVDCIHCKDIREQELLEGVELVLQLLDRIGAGLGHGLFSGFHAEQRKRAAETAHRLSEVAE